MNLNDFDRELRKRMNAVLHSGPCSVKQFAAEIEKSESLVYEACNPYPSTSAVPSIHWLEPFCRLTGDISILLMIAERLGYTLTALPQASASGDVQKDYIAVAAEVGDIAGDIKAALDKGGPGGENITAPEWAQIEKDRLEAMAALARLRGPGVAIPGVLKRIEGGKK